jgi:hypothetical protein
MAFPTVVNTATSSTASGGIVWAMPASIVAGRLLLAFVGEKGSSDSGDTVSGWTKLGETNRSADFICLYSFAKIAVGSDSGGNFFGGNQGCAAIVYQISGWKGTPLSNVKVAVSSTSLATLTPPSLSVPSAADYLWIPAVITGGTVTGAPTNYGSLLTKVSGSGSPTPTLGTAQRNLNASSEAPGAFAGTATTPLAHTIGIPPVPSVAGRPAFINQAVKRAAYY